MATTDVDTLAFKIWLDDSQAARELHNYINLTDVATEKTQRLLAVVESLAKHGPMGFNDATTKALGLEKSIAKIEKVAETPNLKQLPKVTSSAASGFGVLEGAINSLKHVLIGMIAFRIISFFLDLGKAMGEATKQAQDFYKSLVNITMGVRAMQRAGADISFSDATKALQEFKKQFPVLSNAEIAAGFNNILLKTAQMNLSWQDNINIMKVAAGTYAVTGKTIDQVSDSIINAMVSSSGNMTKNLLENTKLQIDSHMIAAKAQELGIANIKKGISALTEEERARTVLAVIMEQYADKQSDVNASMDTIPARVEAVNKSWDDFKVSIGNVGLEIKATLAPYLLALIPIVETLTKVLLSSVAIVASFGLALDKAYDSKKGLDFKKFVETFQESLRNMMLKPTDNAEQLGKAFGENLGDGVKKGLEESLSQDQMDALDKFEQDIKDLQKDFARDLENDIKNRSRKWQDIWTDYFRKLRDLETQYNQDVADANRSSQNDIESANRKYRDAEIKAEEDYQRRLQNLRDNFLFNMEDALRERDAKQALRLIRQYQLDKKNLTNEFEDGRKDRLRDFQRELEDIERQKQERLYKLAEEYAQKRAMAAQDRKDAIDDANLAFAREREDAKIKQGQRLQDLVDALAEQGLATQQGAEAIRKIMMDYFGPGGYTDQIYNYLIQEIQNAAVAAAQAALLLQSIKERTRPKSGGGTTPAMASGGTMFASHPTQVQFGEVPEVATFTPLSQLYSHGNSQSGVAGVEGIGGSLNVKILLSDGLEAEIINKSVRNVSVALNKIQREKS